MDAGKYSFDGRILEHLDENFEGYYEVPEGVISIADGALMFCGKLSAISLPSTLTKIGEYAFKSCENLESIIIPDSVTYIGPHAFWMCRSLKNVTLSNNLKELKPDVFCETAIEEIVIPDSVESIDEEAFKDCPFLINIKLPKDIHIADNAFDGCTALYSSDAIYLSLYNNPHYKLVQVFPWAGEFRIPNNVVEIGAYAFRDCEFTTLEIPPSVKKFDQCAFSGLRSLKSIKVGNGVSSLPNDCFENCTSLEEVKLTDGITTIGERCFKGCTSLKSLHLPNAVNAIGNDCFENCIKLEIIELPSQLAVINDSVFEGCDSLKTLTFGDHIVKVGCKAFKNCKSLDDIHLPDSVQSIGSESFFGCISLKRISFSNQIEIIPYKAFYGCQNLETISLPTNLDGIEDEAFSGCIKLKEVLNAESVDIKQDSFRRTLIDDCRLQPRFKYYGKILPSQWQSDTISGDVMLRVYRGIHMDNMDIAKSVIADIKENGLYLEQMDKFPNRLRYISNQGHNKISIDALDNLYANNIPLDSALEGFDENQVYFGDYLCAMCYALRGSDDSVGIIIEAEMSLDELNVDGTDSLDRVFNESSDNHLLKKIFSEKIDLYYEKIRAETVGVDCSDEISKKIRCAVRNMAKSDNDIVYSFYRNEIPINGKCGTIFKSAFQAKLPVAADRIISVKIAPRDFNINLEASRDRGINFTDLA